VVGERQTFEQRFASQHGWLAAASWGAGPRRPTQTTTNGGSAKTPISPEAFRKFEVFTPTCLELRYESFLFVI